jgi:hypothetical protein
MIDFHRNGLQNMTFFWSQKKKEKKEKKEREKKEKKVRIRIAIWIF